MLELCISTVHTPMCTGDAGPEQGLVLFFQKYPKFCQYRAPGILRIWREWLFIFRDLGSTGNYFRGAGEQAHSFRDLGSPAKK